MDLQAPIEVLWLGTSSWLGQQNGVTFRPSTAPLQRRDRREIEDLGTAKRFEEWLEAAADEAAQLAAVDLDLADS
jgi:hypothetical protein